MGLLEETYNHANYFNVDLRVESNCSDFQNTGSSPRKLKEIWVEWCETFLYNEEEIEHGRFGKKFKSVVHARSFALALVMNHINTTMLKEGEYEHWEGWDYKDNLSSHRERGDEYYKVELKKVLFGHHNYEGLDPSNKLVIEYVFDFENE